MPHITVASRGVSPGWLSEEPIDPWPVALDRLAVLQDMGGRFEVNFAHPLTGP